MMMRINPEKINSSEIEQAVTLLKNGGIIIYPTDSVYGLGCDITQPKAIERICKLKNIKPEKANFSFLCSDLSHLSDYTTAIPNNIFRAMRRVLPGPFTFIFEASSKVPKLLKQNKKTIGIRVPDHPVCHELIEKLGNPIMSTSIRNNNDDLMEYYSDPELIYQEYNGKIDLMIDAGFGNIYPTTVIDCTGPEPVLIREGIGDYQLFVG